MTDLLKKELEQYREYRTTFLTSEVGQRVLADLMDVFLYNRIALPETEMGLAKCDGARDVIRYIFSRLGLGDDSSTFVKALGVANLPAPKPMDTQKTGLEE